MLHQRYIELAKLVVAQLQHFDNTMRDAVRDKPEPNNDQATIIPASMKQFDSGGLPMSPQSPQPIVKGSRPWQWWAFARTLAPLRSRGYQMARQIFAAHDAEIVELVRGPTVGESSKASDKATL
jgi:hypothetical protein